MQGQNSSDTDGTEHKDDRRKSSTKPWKIAIPSVVIVAAFYSQGRAYYEGYLDYLGISTSQFPLSTTDAYWEALMGWVVLVSKGVPAIWEAYPRYLAAIWMLLLAVILMNLPLWLADRYGLRERCRASLQAAQIGARLKKRHFGFAILAMTVWILSVPVLLMGAMFIVALFIVVLVVPFYSLGHTGAQQYCETAASRVPVAHFAGEERPAANGETSSEVRLLQCSSDFCALIREGKAFVIPREALNRADGVPIVPTSGNKKKGKVTKVPLQDQLCYKPANAEPRSSRGPRPIPPRAE
jgi:hypothetical protein